MANAKINNVAYSWSMIQLTTTGITGESTSNPIFVDCTAVSWSTERKIESIYGLGGQPRKRGFGNVTYSASITLPYSTQVELRSKSSDGTLLGLGEFNLVVSWVNDLAQNVTTETVTIAGCLLAQSGMTLLRMTLQSPKSLICILIASTLTRWHQPRISHGVAKCTVSKLLLFHGLGRFRNGTPFIFFCNFAII